MRFKKIHPHEFRSNIAHSKEEIIFFQKMKKFGGGQGGGTGSNFTLKVLGIFQILKIVAFHDYHEKS